MGNVLIRDTTMYGIADAIREKGETSALLHPGEMRPAILALPSGGGSDIDTINGLIDKTISGVLHFTTATVTTAGLSGCAQLEGIDAPNLTRISDNGCYSCTNLASVYAPNLELLGSSALRGTALVSLDAPLSMIQQMAFQDSRLELLILRGPNVCTLANVSAFSGTPIAEGNGYIYVWRTLVDSYKTTGNWPTFADQIRAIEDYPEITDGTK